MPFVPFLRILPGKNENLLFLVPCLTKRRFRVVSMVNQGFAYDNRLQRQLRQGITI